ncbi:hypothetical protein AgCh_025141 [Apium graveolens]
MRLSIVVSVVTQIPFFALHFVEFTVEDCARNALSLAGTMLGFYLVRALPSKTAIAPVNYIFAKESGFLLCRSSAELPLHLNHLHDLNYKLEYFSPTSKHISARCSSSPPGDEACQEHWKAHSLLAGILDIVNIVVSKSSVSTSVFVEILLGYNKEFVSFFKVMHELRTDVYRA